MRSSPGTMSSPEGGTRRAPLDRQGRALVALSSIAPAMLFLSAIVVVWLGSEFFRTNIPDPLGRAATRYAGSTLCFVLTGVTAVFLVLGYTLWYKSALAEGEGTNEVGAHWAGATLILVGIPYFIFGLLYGGEFGGQLLLWGSLLAFTVGTVFYFSHLLWKRPAPTTLAPRGTR